jgi:pyruvate kinase
MLEGLLLEDSIFYPKNMKTKIIATIGPASWDESVMESLLLAGADVFRFNMKHDTPASHKKNIIKAKGVAKKLEQKLEILGVLQGPEIRILTPLGEDLEVKKGDEVIFSSEFIADTPSLKVPDADIIFKELNPGDTILLDDGFQSFVVTDRGNVFLTARAENDYSIVNKKGMNLPGKVVDLPALTDLDLERLDAMAEVGVDYVSYSFVRNANDIALLRKEMDSRGIKAKLVAKIENQSAVDDVDAIIASSDVVMVARGDLGLEVPIEKLAFYQKEIVKKCNLAGVPVIVATQMLQSMITNPRPTRAEAVDVANAVLDGANFIMLSGETAMGDYPADSLKVMRKISSFYEEE